MTPRGAALVLLELTWTGDNIRRLNTTLDHPHYAQIMPSITVALIQFFYYVKNVIDIVDMNLEQ